MRGSALVSASPVCGLGSPESAFSLRDGSYRGIHAIPLIFSFLYKRVFINTRIWGKTFYCSLNMGIGESPGRRHSSSSGDEVMERAANEKTTGAGCGGSCLQS